MEKSLDEILLQVRQSPNIISQIASPISSGPGYLFGNHVLVSINYWFCRPVAFSDGEYVALMHIGAVEERPFLDSCLRNFSHLPNVKAIVVQTGLENSKPIVDYCRARGISIVHCYKARAIEPDHLAYTKDVAVTPHKMLIRFIENGHQETLHF